jgi:hypothetical protein
MKVATHHSKRRVNYIREDCTPERGSNQGAAERTCEGKRRRNAKWPAGSRSGEADTSWTL